jgi:hypothetical protein
MVKRMIKTFEELWTKCEDFNKNTSNTNDSINEILMKFNLYLSIDKKEISNDEKNKLKNRVMGEILLSLSNISLLDNINIFAALHEAYQYRSLEKLNIQEKK